MFVQPSPSHIDRSDQLNYWLRRAEQEAIVAIRSGNPEASSSHARMAQAYSAMATSLLVD